VEQNVVEERPKTVASRFELAASRMAEQWLSAGHMSVSAGDLRIAREFLEQTGITVEETPGVLIRLTHRDGRTQEMTREGAVMLALRRLAGRA
jgi:hypothetical protein